MKIKKVTPVGRSQVFDISVKDCEHYILQNGVVTHNTGIEYSSNTVITIGKRQVKDGTELQGFEFIMNANKSRYIKEQSKIAITVTFEGGVSVWSGLMDVALATGHVIKPKNGWYTRPQFDNEKNWRMAATNCPEFWEPLLDDDKFCSDVEALFALNSNKSLELLDDGTFVVEAIVPEFDPETGEILE